jgi:hypothetical protein
MCDVNPLGPMMHMKEIERDALALRAVRMESRSGALNIALAWVVKLLKRPSVSLKVMNAVTAQIMSGASRAQSQSAIETNPADRPRVTR